MDPQGGREMTLFSWRRHCKMGGGVGGERLGGHGGSHDGGKVFCDNPKPNRSTSAIAALVWVCLAQRSQPRTSIPPRGATDRGWPVHGLSSHCYRPQLTGYSPESKPKKIPPKAAKAQAM